MSNASFTLFSKKVFTDERRVQGFLVRVCNGKNAQTGAFSCARWVFVGPDGERYLPTIWSDIQPAYPDGSSKLTPGECANGYLTLDTKAKLTGLRYENADGERFVFDVGWTAPPCDTLLR